MCLINKIRESREYIPDLENQLNKIKVSLSDGDNPKMVFKRSKVEDVIDIQTMECICKLNESLRVLGATSVKNKHCMIKHLKT